MKKKTLSMALAVALVLGLAAPVLAVGPTFSDVPESHWGYADIEAVAEAGLMNGTGNGAFRPEMKVSVAQFLTLLGRLVFPEIEVGEGDTWFGPYVSACNNSGLLDGTQLVATNNLDAEISRYDMAVILRAAAKKLGVAEKAAQSGEVTDYLDIPIRYADAVLAVYGMGLIRGDQAGNFNGSNTMMRSEVATVIMRLAKAKPEGISTYVPQTENTQTAHVSGDIFLNDGERVKLAGIPVGLFTADDRLVDQTVTDSSGNWSMDVTLDDKDTNIVFSDRTPITFYADVLAPVDYNGVHYATSFSSLRRIYSDRDASNTWGIRLCRSEAYVCKTDDTPKDYDIYVPKSDDTVTFAEHGFVLCYEEGEGSSTPSGVKVGVFLSQNGSQPLLVAQTVTDAEGKWSVDITMDEEDYNRYHDGSSFWASILEPVTYNGKLYIGGKTGRFLQIDWGDNWDDYWADTWLDNHYLFSSRVIHLYGPKTFTVHGSISGRYPDDLVMPGIPVGFFLKDGRLLGQTTTDAEGKWSMEVTVDSEDYSDKESIYYADILAPIEYNGVRYEEGSRLLNSLSEMYHSKGWRFIASTSEFGYLKHEH